jgi:hypothetical protein
MVLTGKQSVYVLSLLQQENLQTAAVLEFCGPDLSTVRQQVHRLVCSWHIPATYETMH